MEDISLDFESAYFNANGRDKQKYLLHKFGKILKQRRPVVIQAIRNAKIPMGKKANPKMILATIKSHPNNKRLLKNLAILIAFDNEMVKRRNLAKKRKYSALVGNNKDGQPRGQWITNAFQKDPNKVQGEGWNKVNQFFGGGKPLNETKLGMGFNNVFQGQTDSDGNKIPSKAGNFFNQNKEQLWDFGTMLYSGLSNKNGEQQVEESFNSTPPANDGGGGGNNAPQNNNTGGNNNNNNNTGGGSTMLIVGGVVVVGIIAVVIIMANKKKNN